jgi:Arc/MetJ-type ribon-helix-helix transcriptional regulator
VLIYIHMTTINISLPDKLKKQADKLIKDGYYASFSDLVRTGLRQMIGNDIQKSLPKQKKEILPKRLHQYFWDTDPAQIDLDKNKEYIAERVLDWGQTEDVRWLINTYGKELIKTVVKNRRGLSPKSAIFWADILGINQREVACLSKPYQNKPFGP